MKRQILALTVAVCLLLAACTLLASCGSRTEAATMHLRKTEGTVGVSDGEGKDLEPRENLGLYSGYGVDTRAESYAWVNLDSVKLTKLDQNSKIEIVKEDRHLTIEVKSGNLFFDVTEPLAEDESLDIRTSTMAVGIRGTCGWVEVPDPEHMTLGLLGGTVECTAGTETVSVSAGEMAVMASDGTVQVTELSQEDIPAFVLTELDETASAEPVIGPLFQDPDTIFAPEEPGDGSRPSGYTEYWNDDLTPSSRVDFSYEEEDRVRLDTYTWGGGAWTHSGTSYAAATYNDQGREMEVMSYNAQGELVEYYILFPNYEDYAVYTAAIQMENSPASYTDYYEQGQRVRREYEGGGTVTFEYDSQGRLAQTHNQTGTGAVAHHIFEYGQGIGTNEPLQIPEDFNWQNIR